ncbi:hypothetical protein JHK84_043148 [Glycine max]|nr:hypothetical protein JHK84_043148 [Glycine max]
MLSSTSPPKCSVSSANSIFPSSHTEEHSTSLFLSSGTFQNIPIPIPMLNPLTPPSWTSSPASSSAAAPRLFSAVSTSPPSTSSAMPSSAALSFFTLLSQHPHYRPHATSFCLLVHILARAKLFSEARSILHQLLHQQLPRLRRLQRRHLRLPRIRLLPHRLLHAP